MNNSSPSILVIGAGAVGGITAAFMKRAGHDVTLVAKYPEYAGKIRTSGIAITGVRGRIRETVPAVSHFSEIKDKKDLIFLAVKANDLVATATAALPLLKPDGYMISMQNGMCDHDLAQIAGAERTVGCVVGWGATMTSPGEMIMTSKGDFIIGYPSRPGDADLETVASVLECVVPVIRTANITGHRYSKLIINACITSPGAVCGLYLGQMLSHRRMRRVFVNIIREAIAVADALDIEPEVFGGRLDFRKFISGSGFVDDLRRDITIRIIGFKYRKLKSSSLQSIERGKATEIAWLNGYIADKAAGLGIPVPVNRKIIEIIRRIERGELPVSIKNFDDPVFD